MVKVILHGVERILVLIVTCKPKRVEQVGRIKQRFIF